MPNTYVNKVTLSNGTTLIDLTSDTVTSAAHIVSGRIGHLADGSQVTGTGSGGGVASIEDVPNATGTTAVIDGTDASHIVADYDLSETALGSDGSVDLSEAIEALTTYSNEVTGESDTTLSDAVGTLAAGYGGGDEYKFIEGSFSGAYVNNELTGLRNYAFAYYTAHNFSFSSTSVQSLGYNVFQGANITSFSAPNLTGSTNNANAFNAAKKLTFLDMGSVAQIYSNFAYNANALTVMVLRQTSVVTLVNVNAFGNTPFRGYNGGTGTIYVPSNLISSYQTATNWKTIYDEGACSFVALESSQYK